MAGLARTAMQPQKCGVKASLLTFLLVVVVLMMYIQSSMYSTQLVAAAPPIMVTATATGIAQTTLHGVRTENISRDNRFRVEIRSYHNILTLPDSCSKLNMTPPQPVTSQSVYTNCSEPRVPNIVHLVWLYGAAHSFTFRQLLSGLSMLRFIQPCCILLWYDGSAPTGNYWQQFMANMTAQNIHMQMLKITVPNKIWDKKIAYPEHKTDIIRFEVLKHFGGIYMDLDVLIVKSVRPLRCFDYTLGREDNIRLTGSLIFSVPHAPFLLKVIENYKKYRSIWAYNSVEYPHQLARQQPALIHVEENSINRPSWHPSELNAIFDKSCKIKWQKNYAIHLWNHNTKKYLARENSTSIKNMTSTFGQVARYIYYGTPQQISV